jgi:hypothetical protein
LAQTTTLDILELNVEPSDKLYSHLMTIADEKILDRIITALDVPIWAFSQEDCTTRYRLRFHLADDRVEQFDYHIRWDRWTHFDFGETCHPNQDSILRGDQELLAPVDGGKPPGTFDALIREQIASTWSESINVVERLGLDRTVKIEIVETVLGETVDEDGLVAVSVEAVSRLISDDPQVIDQLVAMLDTEHRFVGRALFHPSLELRFRLDGGTVHTLIFSSGGDNPSVLRGDPHIWEGRDIRPSADFGALIDTLLASAH